MFVQLNSYPEGIIPQGKHHVITHIYEITLNLINEKFTSLTLLLKDSRKALKEYIIFIIVFTAYFNTWHLHNDYDLTIIKSRSNCLVSAYH